MAITVRWQAAIAGDPWRSLCIFCNALATDVDEDSDFIHALTWQAKVLKAWKAE
jgi:hypothetical protein